MMSELLLKFKHYIDQTTTGRLALSSKLVRIETAGSRLTICLNKLIGRSTFSKGKRTASQQACSCSTMHPATRNAPAMLFLLARCPNARTKAGLATRMARGCDLEHVQGPHRTSTFLTITPQCLAGSRGWRLSFESGACGQMEDSTLSAVASNACLIVLTAAAAVSYSANPTLSPNNHSSWNTSRRVDTFAISTQNSTVSLTISSSIGEPSNFAIDQLNKLPIWKQWKRMSSIVLMMFRYCRFKGKSPI